MNQNARLMSLEELASYLGLSAGTLYNRTSRRAKDPLPIKVLRPCGRLKFDRVEVDSWIEAGCPDKDTWTKQS